jgi:RNA polymerase sigma-70 factor, ECF subfamily
MTSATIAWRRRTDEPHPECGDGFGEARLVERARRDPEAFAELYRSHYAAIGAYLFRRCGDVHTTEDLLSDVFLAALRGVGRYRARGVPFRHWLYRIATRAANRWAARERRRPKLLESPSEVVDERGDAGADERAAVRRDLLRLAPRYQAVLVLHYVEGLSVADVARALGRRPGTVKSRLARGRAALERAMRSRR